MINMFKNIVSTEEDAKKYHLRSYHEMLEIALLKNYELNQNFLKSLQVEFNISQHEHDVIMQTITHSNDKLDSNILEIIQKMDYLSEVHNEIYDDSTVEVSFFKSTIEEEFNKYSQNLFNLLENIYLNNTMGFKACRETFSYVENEIISLNTLAFSFMSPSITNSLQKIHNSIYKSKVINHDNNLVLLSKLLSLENENINIATIVCLKNYTFNNIDLDRFINHANSDIKELTKKIIAHSDGINIYEKMAFLNMVPLFVALNFSELYSVANKSYLVDYEEEQYVIKQGESTHNLYVIISGDVDVIKDSKKINELSSGDFFGEIAIVAKIQRTASIRASTHLSVLMFSEDSFNELISKYPNISVQIMREMTKRLLQNNS